MAKFFAVDEKGFLLVKATRELPEAKQAVLLGVLEYLRRGTSGVDYVEGLKTGLLLCDDMWEAIQRCHERGDNAGAEEAVAMVQRVYELCLEVKP